MKKPPELSAREWAVVLGALVLAAGHAQASAAVALLGADTTASARALATVRELNEVQAKVRVATEGN